MDYRFVKKGGNLASINRIHSWIDQEVGKLNDGEFVLSLNRFVKKRSINQNRLMWLWFKCIECETGQQSIDIHDYYCHKFLQREISNPVTGEVVMVDGKTSGLNTVQMTEFLNKIQADAAEEFFITLPLPEDSGYDEFMLQYERYVS